MKRIILIYPNAGADDVSGCLAAARLGPALEAAGATVQVHRLDQGHERLLDAVAAGALPVVIKAGRREP